MPEIENTLVDNKHALICIDDYLIELNEVHHKELEYVKNNFCGIVISNAECLHNHIFSPNTIVYLCGNIDKTYQTRFDNTLVYVIKEFSKVNDDDTNKYKWINIGSIPINIYNTGVYFRHLFDSNINYFDHINNEHNFQSLTDSNKSSSALRTGIYLSHVKENNDEIKFNLLRCSSNLNGPTDNFHTTDHDIVNQVNNIAEHFFNEKTKLNHVLAQIYNNTTNGGINKSSEKKAKIKDHSDKTKDMPRNGLMAFCTFYKSYACDKFNDPGLKHVTRSNDDFYDYCINNVSVLTKLRFRLKNMVTDQTLKKKFDIILYPNSVFIMSLLTNRLYTHEIIPSILPIDKIPIRMGYVIRCSKTKAIFKNNKTYIRENDNDVELIKPTDEGIKELKNLYYKENMTDEMIYYDKFYFSLNNGDYEKPLV